MGNLSAASELLRRHLELEALQGDGGNGDFLSGWQCDNPRRDDIQCKVDDARSELDGSRYQYLDLGDAIVDKLSAFHRMADGRNPQAIFCGEGVTSIILAFCAWLRENDVDEIFYVPPLYFSFLKALHLFDIRARPVSQKHAFEQRFSMNLPPCKCVFALTDPVWYAGMNVEAPVIEQIAEWQRRTGSLVFVDGSFQYTQWNHQLLEYTSNLDSGITIRVVCPTKALAFHGYRFAYATMPASIYPKFAHMYTSLYGSTSIDNLAFAAVAAELVQNRRIIESVFTLAADRHTALRLKDKIAAAWQATCGYFVFERILAPVESSTVLMDGAFFQQSRYADHRRINLLSPSIGTLR